MLSARANRMAASKYSDTKEDNYTLKDLLRKVK